MFLLRDKRYEFANLDRNEHTRTRRSISLRQRAIGWFSPADMSICQFVHLSAPVAPLLYMGCRLLGSKDFTRYQQTNRKPLFPRIFEDRPSSGTASCKGINRCSLDSPENHFRHRLPVCCESLRSSLNKPSFIDFYKLILWPRFARIN